MAAAPLFIFDLDNTLYPPDVTLWRVVDARIERYVAERLGLDPRNARRIRKEYLREFGTTLRGLMRRHGVEPGDYLEYVHDVPIPDLVPSRPELGAMLSGLPGRSVVFTNGSESYARRVLAALGVLDAMEGIYGIEFMEYMAKPSPYPYGKLLRTMRAAASDSLLCEDVHENLAPAQELGIFTVLVTGRKGSGADSSPGIPAPAARAVVADVCDLPAVLPLFLENGGCALPSPPGPAGVPAGRTRREGGRAEGGNS
jgi:putative hydrolase of the HAD superfamily